VIPEGVKDKIDDYHGCIKLSTAIFSPKETEYLYQSYTLFFFLAFGFYCVQSIVLMLRLNVPMALKLAFDGLKGSQYKTRATFVDDDVSRFRSVELSVLLCSDEHKRKANRDWRSKNHSTDVVTMSSYVPRHKPHIVRIAFSTSSSSS